MWEFLKVAEVCLARQPKPKPLSLAWRSERASEEKNKGFAEKIQLLGVGLRLSDSVR